MYSWRAWALIAAIACGDGPKHGTDGAGGNADDTGAANGSDGDTGAPGTPDALPLVNGKYLVGFSVGTVAGLVVPLQVEIAMSADEADQRTIDTFIIRATDGAESVSEDLTRADGIPVSEDGSFIAVLPVFALPAEYSPTGNPVELDATMTGTVLSETFFCGEVSGAIVSFDMDLAGSTFGAVAWEDRILGAPSACEATDLEPVARIETCPVVTEGRNEVFLSGGEERFFDLVLPDGYDPATQYPLVFAMHGIGSSIENMIYNNGLADYAAANGFMVVAPAAMDRGGTEAWDPVGSPDLNLDIVLVDDLATCIGEQYSVDPDRTHVTGMSLGGLMTGTLIATRSELFVSAAPLSGGLMTLPSEDTLPIPTLVTWGGVDDVSHGQDFNGLAQDMIDTLVAHEHFVVACEHGMGHITDATFWPYVFGFFTDHPRAVSVETYLDGLPDYFPAYCAIVAQDPGS